jgi:hypothetical protein
MKRCWFCSPSLSHLGPFGAFFQIDCLGLMKCSSTAGMLLLKRRPPAAPDLVVMRFVDETVFQERRLTYMGIDLVVLL